MAVAMSYRVLRDGDAPLVFEGEQLAAETGPIENGIEHARWYNLAVYRTDAGQYVLAREFRTVWQGEFSAHEGWVYATLDEVRDQLRHIALPPTRIGFPEGERWNERQTRVIATLTALYHQRVSALLDACGIEERVA